MNPVLLAFTFQLLMTAGCPTTLNLPEGTSVWVSHTFAGPGVVVIADSDQTLPAMESSKQRRNADGFGVFEFTAFGALSSETAVTFSCNENIDDDAFAPIRLRRNASHGDALQVRLESADALLRGGHLAQAFERYSALAADSGAHSVGVLAALTALEVRRRLGQSNVVAKEPLNAWLGRVSSSEPGLGDELRYRGARAALSWQNYDAALKFSAYHERTRLLEMRRQALQLTAITEAMTAAYLAQDDARVAKLYKQYHKELADDSSAWSLLTMASESFLELDLPNEALSAFAKFSAPRQVISSTLLHIDAALAAQRQSEARVLIAQLREQARGQQKQRLDQLARAVPGEKQ